MSKKTKIFYLIERIARAGTELHLLKLLSGLDRERYEPILCVLNGQMSDPDLLPNDIKTHDLEAGWNLVRPSFVGVWSRLIAVLKEEQPDILHSFLFVANAIGPFAARRAGVPHIVASRGRMGIEWDAGAMHRHLQAAADKRTDRILCKTAAMRDEILEYEKVAPDKIDIVPNGVDLSKFTLGRGGIYQQRLELQNVHGIKPDGPLILALGNLKPIKGHEVLLRAASLLSQRFKAYQIVILGEGEARPDLEKQIDKPDIGEHVKLPGKMNDVRAWMSASDLFVSTSHSEGMPNAVLEAMAMAVPLVLSDIPGHREAAGEAAWFFEPRDAEDLAETIARALSNPSERAERASLGRRRIEENFSLTVMVQRIAGIYEELVNRESGS